MVRIYVLEKKDTEFVTLFLRKQSRFLLVSANRRHFYSV